HRRRSVSWLRGDQGRPCPRASELGTDHHLLGPRRLLPENGASVPLPVRTSVSPRRRGRPLLYERLRTRIRRITRRATPQGDVSLGDLLAAGALAPVRSAHRDRPAPGGPHRRTP